jgi:hypothetical protein
VHIAISSADGTIFSISLITIVVMKLILLLVAIYSLIFYQQYKIEKANASGASSKGIFKTNDSFQHIDLPDKDGSGNAEMLMRNQYSVHSHSNTRERSAMAAFSFGK